MTKASDPEAPFDLEAAIDGLYRGEPEAFTEARNRLAKTCKQRGDREGAERVKALRKPSVSAWVVNALWWEDRAAFDASFEAARRVRDAQMQGGLAVQQAAAAKRRRALDDLLAHARQRLESTGRATTPAVLRRIATTLEACAALADNLPSPGPGRLSEDLDPPGFEAWSVGPPLARPVEPAVAAEPDDPPAPAPPDPDERRVRAEQALLQARAYAAQILRLAEEARGALQNADLEVEARTLRWTHAMDALAIAQHAAQRATEERDEAKTRAQAAQQAWTQKQAELEAARQALAAAEEALRLTDRGEPDAG